MGEFLKNQLPDAVSYYESEGLTLQAGRKWRTSRCDFHGGSDSLRINTESGAFICMAGCGARGGDVLAYHMAAHGLAFVDAAKALGAYREDGQSNCQSKPLPVPARALLEVAGFELTVCVVALADALKGRISDQDLDRFRLAAARVIYIAEVANVR